MADNTCTEIATTWTSTSGSTINNALLTAAKSLLKNIYTYSAVSPDYLPTSYTNLNPGLSSYVVHSARDTYVYWPPVEGQQERICWTSQPGTAPKGWSGTVTKAGLYDLSASAPHAADMAACFTDCSGFITSLFTYVNQQTATAFNGWQATKENTIPEAGCFNPGDIPTHPNEINYYNFFTQASCGFQAVSLADIQPGDLIAWANTKTPPKDTGHIMLVAAVADAPGDTSGQTKQIVVIDESSGHTHDTRDVKGGALGLGIIVLSINNPKKQLQFFWTVEKSCEQPPNPQPGMVAIGRAI